MPRQAAVLLIALAVGAAQAFAEEPGAGRRAELETLLLHDCGSCHGMTLQGGLGLPLLPAALSGMSEDMLVATILEGRPGTAMPGWRPMLNETDARWLARRLKEGA